MKKKFGVKSKIIFGTFIISLIFLVTVIKLALYKENIKNYEISLSSDCITKVVSATALNKEMQLSLSEINELLVSFLHRNFYLSLTDHDQIKIIIPTKVFGCDVNFVSCAFVTLCDSDFKIKLFDTSVGKLPVPKNVSLSLLRKHLSSEMKIVDDEIFVPACFKFRFQDTDFDIKVRSFSLKSGVVTLKTEGGFEGTISMIKNKASSFLNSLYKN